MARRRRAPQTPEVPLDGAPPPEASVDEVVVSREDQTAEADGGTAEAREAAASGRRRGREISYNEGHDLEAEESAWVRTNMGTVSLVQVSNRSLDEEAHVWISAGPWNTYQQLAANARQPFVEVRDFGGSVLMITNLGPGRATLRLLVVGM